MVCQPLFNLDCHPYDSLFKIPQLPLIYHLVPLFEDLSSSHQNLHNITHLQGKHVQFENCFNRLVTFIQDSVSGKPEVSVNYNLLFPTQNIINIINISFFQLPFRPQYFKTIWLPRVSKIINRLENPVFYDFPPLSHNFHKFIQYQVI